MERSGCSWYKGAMVRANIHFPQEKIAVGFESEYAFVKWLGYLKEHGMATARIAGSPRSLYIFKTHITYIETDTSAKLPLGF